jgi:hypothetical protein
MDIKVKGGTPETGVTLCVTCSYSVIRRGFGTSEEEIVCRATRPAERVRFAVYECSAYVDRRRPTLYSMEQIAWVLVTKTAGRSIGFVTAKRFRDLEGRDAEIVPSEAYNSEKVVTDLK